MLTLRVPEGCSQSPSASDSTDNDVSVAALTNH